MGTLLNVTLKFGHIYQMWYHVPGSVLNVTISWYGITVTISQSWQQQHAKYNTIVHDNTCTKWNNNDWSYPGYGSKCGIIVVMVLLLWSLFFNFLFLLLLTFLFSFPQTSFSGVLYDDHQISFQTFFVWALL